MYFIISFSYSFSRFFPIFFYSIPPIFRSFAWNSSLDSIMLHHLKIYDCCVAPFYYREYRRYVLYTFCVNLVRKNVFFLYFWNVTLIQRYYKSYMRESHSNRKETFFPLTDVCIISVAELFFSWTIEMMKCILVKKRSYFRAVVFHRRVWQFTAMSLN